MAVLCVNCGAPAEFYVSDPGVNPLDYCGLHLPAHWRDRVLAGHLPNSQALDPHVRANDNKPFGDYAVDQAAIAARFAVPVDKPAPPTRGRAKSQ